MAWRAATALAVLLAVALCACGGGGSEPASPHARVCDRTASPGPAAAQRLVDSLRPGEVGCLAGGTYRESLKIGSVGTAAKPITLQPSPGERATIQGLVEVTGASRNLVVRGLYFDGRNDAHTPSLIVNGHDIRFVDNDVTNDHSAICFILGNYQYGIARDVTIESNRIHDCGQLPATNLQQGIYVSVSRDARIVGNWIYDNADQGIQLYPDARGTQVTGNVIDGNGEGIIFGGADRVSATDNLVEGNVLSNSRLRYNVEWHFDGPVGRGNVLRRNCVGGGARDDGNGGIQEPAIGFSAAANVAARPAFRGAGDYRLKPRSACRRVFSGDPEAVPGPSQR